MAGSQLAKSHSETSAASWQRTRTEVPRKRSLRLARGHWAAPRCCLRAQAQQRWRWNAAGERGLSLSLSLYGFLPHGRGEAAHNGRPTPPIVVAARAPSNATKGALCACAIAVGAVIACPPELLSGPM